MSYKLKLKDSGEEVELGKKYLFLVGPRAMDKDRRLVTIKGIEPPTSDNPRGHIITGKEESSKDGSNIRSWVPYYPEVIDAEFIWESEE